MRLLIVQGGFGAGGAEKIVAMLAEHRVARGDDVTVLGFHMPPEGSYFPYPDGVRLISPPTSEGTSPLKRIGHIRRSIKDIRPNATISFLTKINVLSLIASMGTGCPVAISERNNPRAQNAHPAWRHAQHLFGRRANAIVMQTERARADLPAALQQKSIVIHNPCAPYPNLTVAPQPDGLRLAAVGRLDKQKGFDMLLAAMPKVVATCPGVQLTIYGEGPERTNLEAQRAELGLADCVFLPGSSTTPGEWLTQSDVLVTPSRFEGFPNVIAEATVSGLPVIAFDCDYGPQELIISEQNGVLVPIGDIEALSQSIIDLLRSKGRRERMSGAASLNLDRLAPDYILGQWDKLITRIARTD